MSSRPFYVAAIFVVCYGSSHSGKCKLVKREIVQLKTEECNCAAIEQLLHLSCVMSLGNEVRSHGILESAFEKHRNNINVDEAR